MARPSAPKISLRFDPPGEPLTLGRVKELGLAQIHKGAVRAGDCDEHGLMRADGVIARVWDGVPHAPASSARVERRPYERIGSVALEYRLVYRGPVRPAICWRSTAA